MDYQKFFLTNQINILLDLKYNLKIHLIELYRFKIFQMSNCLTPDYICPLPMTFLNRPYYDLWFESIYLIKKDERIIYLTYNYYHDEFLCKVNIDVSNHYVTCQENQIFKSPLLTIKCY
jgi:hypothetical protein